MARRDAFACYRCHVVKPRAAFPIGRTRPSRAVRFKRLSSVCMACVEVEAHGRDAVWERITTTRLNPKTRRWRRRCCDCRQWKEIRAFGRSPAESHGRDYLCRKCASKRAVEYNRQQYATSAVARAKRTADKRRYRAKAVTKAKEAAQRKRRHAAIMADPVKHAEKLEIQRLAYRMGREREGRTVRAGRKNATMGVTSRPMVPALPIVELVHRIAAQRRAVAGLIANGDDPSIGAVCDDLGINERTFRNYAGGSISAMRVGVAERILMNAGVEWFEVYSYDDHAAQFLAEPVAS